MSEKDPEESGADGLSLGAGKIPIRENEQEKKLMGGGDQVRV